MLCWKGKNEQSRPVSCNLSSLSPMLISPRDEVVQFKCPHPKNHLHFGHCEMQVTNYIPVDFNL